MPAKYRRLKDMMTGEVSNELILLVEEHMFIPNDPENTHWKEYQAWLEAGNTPDPAE